MTPHQKFMIIMLYINAAVWTLVDVSGEISDAVYTAGVAIPAAACILDGLYEMFKELRTPYLPKE